MGLDPDLRRHMEAALNLLDGRTAPGSRLVQDAQRLWARVRRVAELAGLPLPVPSAEADALELACHALQLPIARPRDPTPGRPVRGSLRDRCEDAAESLILDFGALVDEPLLDHAARLLRETPHRSPMLDEAKLLADALNLEDFGVLGLVQYALALSRQGQGVLQVVSGLKKRDAYGYWDVRLRDGFHFDPVREMARRRLDRARDAAAQLAAELLEDGADEVGDEL